VMQSVDGGRVGTCLMLAVAGYQLGWAMR